MAYAQPAYRMDASPARVPQRRRQDVRVVPGRGREGQASRQSGAAAASLSIALLARMAAVLLVVVAVLCFARIAITSATVTTLIESDNLSTGISEARSHGTDLQMEQSVLSSTPALNAAAHRMNMTAPYEVGTIELTRDVVAVDAEGNLSFAATVANVTGIQG